MDKILLPGTDLEISQLCYGAGGLGSAVKGDQSATLLNKFLDLGGNFVDTAHVYACWDPAAGSGSSERALKAYFDQIGNRNGWVIATKGGHPALEGYPRGDDYLSPEQIASDIDDSLRNLGTDTIDLYWLHRDDLRLSVSDIVESMNREIETGRIRYLGASNWTCKRLELANAYAMKQGLNGFVASQPQWSLAIQKTNDPTMRSLCAADVNWHRTSEFPVIPYSSTGKGYLADPDRPSARRYDGEESRKRRNRAVQLADELNVTPNQIGLAYLMNHPFPTFPIVGTRNASHLEDAAKATGIRMTEDRVRWLAAPEGF